LPASGDQTGLYKNKKPRCQHSAGEELGQCIKESATNSTTFGGEIDADKLMSGFSCQPSDVVVPATDKECWYQNSSGSSTLGICASQNPGLNQTRGYVIDNPITEPNGGGNVVRARKGDESGSCSEGYLQFDHPYICGNITNLPDCKHDTDPYQLGPTIGSGGQTSAGACRYTDDVGKYGEIGKQYCSFRPRVIVTDQWGFCNTNSLTTTEGTKKNVECASYQNNADIGEWLEGYVLVSPYY